LRQGEPGAIATTNPFYTMSLTVILGPMFAGKSSAILQHIRKANVLGWKHLAITNRMDTRYSNDGTEIMTHDFVKVDAVGVTRLEEVVYTDAYSESKLLILEEGQFFPDLYDFVKRAVEMDGKDVVVVGLDGDSDRNPFGDILRIIPLADDVVKLKALCKRCGDGTPALFSAFRSQKKEHQIQVGGLGMYEPMCRKHYLENQSKTP
jgi:thymidine kinase